MGDGGLATTCAGCGQRRSQAPKPQWMTASGNTAQWARGLCRAPTCWKVSSAAHSRSGVSLAGCGARLKHSESSRVNAEWPQRCAPGLASAGLPHSKGLWEAQMSTTARWMGSARLQRSLDAGAGRHGGPQGLCPGAGPSCRARHEQAAICHAFRA